MTSVHGQAAYKMYLDRSFFFSRSPRASEMCFSVTVWVIVSPRSSASFACRPNGHQCSAPGA